MLTIYGKILGTCILLTFTYLGVIFTDFPNLLKEVLGQLKHNLGKINKMNNLTSMLKKTYKTFINFKIILPLLLIVLFIFLKNILSAYFNSGLIVPYNMNINTSDIDTIRQLLSSSFEGIAGLYAIVVSVAFVIVELISSHYSPRLTKEVTRSKGFVLGILLFSGVLIYDYLFLGFIDAGNLYNLTTLIEINIWITMLAIIYVPFFFFYLMEKINLENYTDNIINRFNTCFYNSMEFTRYTGNQLKPIADDPLPTLIALMVRGIHNESFDFINRTLEKIEINLRNNISDKNFVEVVAYFKPFFLKLILISVENVEINILKKIISINEVLQEKLTNNILMVYITNQGVGTHSTFADNIIFCLQKSVQMNEVTDACLESLERLREKSINLIPKDSENNYLHPGKYTYEQFAELPSNEKLGIANQMSFYTLLKNIYLTDEYKSLFKEAISLGNIKAAKSIILFVVRAQNLLLDSELLKSPEFKIARQDLLDSLYETVELLLEYSQNDKLIRLDVMVSLRITERFYSLLDTDKIIALSTMNILLNSLEREIRNGSTAYFPTSMFNLTGRTIAQLIKRGNDKFKKSDIIYIPKSKDERNNELSIVASIIERYEKYLDPKVGKFPITNYQRFINEKIMSQLIYFLNNGLKQFNEKLAEYTEKLLLKMEHYNKNDWVELESRFKSDAF